MKLPRLPRAARIGLLALSFVGLGKWFMGPSAEQHADPKLYTQDPTHMDSLVKILKKDFASDAAVLFKDPKQHFIYTAPLKGQRFSIYSELNENRKNDMIEKYRKDAKKDKKAAYQNLVCGFIGLCENMSANVYQDTEGKATTAQGFLLPEPGKDKAREKLVKRTLGINYKKLHANQVKLTHTEGRKLTRAFVNGLEKDLDKKLTKINGGDKNAAKNMDPVQRAFLLSMLYQAPNLLGRDSVIVTPLLQKMCARRGASSKKEAFLKLNEFYAASALLHYTSDKLDNGKQRVSYCQRASMIAGNDVSADLLAMQINTACRAQKNKRGGALVVIAGPLPEGTTFQKLLENELCGWDEDGKATVIFLAAAAKAKQNGDDIAVSSKRDEDYGYTIRLSEDNMAGNARKRLCDKIACNGN